MSVVAGARFQRRLVTIVHHRAEKPDPAPL